MKKQCFKIALKLSAEELNEVIKVKEHLSRVLENDFRLNHIHAGFSFLEVCVYTNYTDCTYRIMQDGTTHIHTSLGLIQITNEVGEVLLNVIRNKQENNEYMDIKLLPL